MEKIKAFGRIGISALLAGVVSIGEITNAQSNESQEAEQRVVIDKEDLINEYTRGIEVYGEDKGFPTFYLILQKHAISRMGFDERTEKKGFDDSFACQKNIYEIVKNLHVKRNLELVVLEGKRFDSREDKETKNIIDSGQLAKRREQVEKNPEDLREGMKRAFTGGAYICAKLFPKLHYAGFEERDEKEFERLVDLNKKRIRAEEKIRNTILDQEEYEKAKREIEEGKEFYRFVAETKKKRSLEGIKYSLKHSEEMYKEGIVSNRDVALVIGSKHLPDFQEFLEACKKRENGYNCIVITPKGLE